MRQIFISKNPKERLPDEAGHNGKAGLIFYTVSVFLHAGFFLTMILLQHFSFPEKDMPPAVQVDLVSYDPAIEEVADLKKAPVEKKGPEKPAASAEKADTEPVPETREQKSETIKPDVSLKSKPDNVENRVQPVKKKEKTSLKQKTYKPDKVMAAARENIEKSVEKQKEDQLAEAINRIEARVKEGEKKETDTASAGTGGAASQWKKGSTVINIYNSVLASAIQQNWAFNERLARMDKDLETTVVIKILKTGRIADMWIETRSGNRYLDQSAVKAVKKADPLPPLPEGYTSYDVGLNFSPKGLK